jgi:hypothetical protein
VVRSNRQAPAELLVERATYTVPQFCARNQISRPTYIRLRSQGRGPVEMRPGLNIIRITARAERDWQDLMQEEGEEFETRALERAVKAGNVGAKSEKHISKVSKARAAERDAKAAEHVSTRERLVRRGNSVPPTRRDCGSSEEGLT